MKRLLSVCVVGMLAASSAAAIAGDREERESNRRFLRFWLISTDGPKLGGDRASYLQVPPAPAPGAQGETLSPLSPMPEAYPSPTGPGYILPGPAPPGSRRGEHGVAERVPIVTGNTGAPPRLRPPERPDS